MASADSSRVPVQDQIRKYGFSDGVLPLTETIFTWRAIVETLIIFTVAVGMAWLLDRRDVREGPTRPGDWIESSPLVTLLIVAIGEVWLARHFGESGVLAGLDLNTVNMILLLLAPHVG